MEYIYTLPTSTTFKDRGLLGYAFGPLKQNLDLYYIECEKGHDTFMVSRKITRTYYILSGQGYFTIADRRYGVDAGMLVEVPPGVEYTYSGKMNLLAFCQPGWFVGNDTFTRWNPDVLPTSTPPLPRTRSPLSRIVRFRLFGRSPVSAYLRLNQFLWVRLPSVVTAMSAMRSYGNFLNKLVRLQASRKQALNTFFLRNRAHLQLIQRLAERRAATAPFRVAVLGCSIGAEAYSIAWTIRRVRPDLALALHAVDIAAEAVAVGRRGVYPVVGSELPDDNIFERMSRAEFEEVFDRDGDAFRIKPWIRQGIEWHVRDVRDPEAREALGLYDLVVANNFLCHMDPSSAEACLHNIGDLVRPSGYLIVSGIDLDVRTKVSSELKWRPVDELLEEIHEGDKILRACWPFQYGGLEPLNKMRWDWKQRYAAAFQVPAPLRNSDSSDQGSAIGLHHPQREVALATEPACVSPCY